MNNEIDNQIQGRVLVIDDERPIAIALRRVLMSRHLEVTLAYDGAEGLELLREQPFDLVMLDICMPGLSGMQVLRQIQDHDPLTSVIMMTGHGTVETAVEALKLGAYDYMTKPFPNIFDLCEGVVMDAVRASQARRYRHHHEERQREPRWEGVQGRSLPMQKLFWQMESVVESHGPVLLQGETGTGKLTVARAIYQRAEPNQTREIRCLDCSSTPTEELELMLFGSDSDLSPGGAGLLFQKGALYLGEWMEMEPRLQGRLLEVLRQGALRPWLFAASTESARRAAEQGLLREDLYHRMAAAHLVLPPLRERDGDITLLAQHFLREVAQRRPGTPSELHPETLETLEDAPWYGNVQELRNAIERAALSATEELLLPRDLPAYLTQPTTEALSGFAPELVEMDYAKAKLQVVADFEQRYLVAVMERTSGNVSKAARQAGMDRSNFRRLLKRHQLRA